MGSLSRLAARVFILLLLLLPTGTAIRLKKSRKTNVSVQSKFQTDNLNDASDEPTAASYQAGANAGEEAAGKTAEGGEVAANSTIAGSASLAHIAEDVVEKDFAATLTQAAEDAKVAVRHALSMDAENVKEGANAGEEAAGKTAEGGEVAANSLAMKPADVGGPPVMTPPARATAVKDWKKGTQSILYSFEKEVGNQMATDPCHTDCALCPETVPVGKGYTCLCNPAYRNAVMAGDYTVNVTADHLPYEFLLSGAAFQTSGVKKSACKLLARMLQMTFADQGPLPDDVVASMLVQGRRGRSPEEWKKVINLVTKKGDPKSLFNMVKAGVPLNFEDSGLNIRELMSAIYKLIGPVANALDKIAKDEALQIADLMPSVDKGFVAIKKHLSDEYCQASQGIDAPCKATFFIKEFWPEHNFGEPFDGWCHWRFFNRLGNGSLPVANQRGPYAAKLEGGADINVTIPGHITRNLLDQVLASYSPEEIKWYEAGVGKASEPSDLLEIGAGMSAFIQEDCDCSWDKCQPEEDALLCEGGYKRVAHRVGGRDITGPSGTANKILIMARYLDMPATELYLLRLGCVSWMVLSEDHSLLEVLMGVEDAGLPFPHDSSMYTPSNLLPGSALEADLNDFMSHLKVLHDFFKVGFSESEGPQKLCSA